MTFLRKTLIAGLLTASAAIECRAVVEPTTLYVYGFAASFSDSTVYLTDIMVLDSAWIDSKTKFLYGRDSYSYQLKNYMQNQGVANPTCIISFATTRKKAEKKYVKLRSKYTKVAGAYIVRYLPETDFQFEVVSAADDPMALTADSKAARKAAKEAEKEARKKQKAERHKGMPGGKGGRPSGPPPGV